MLSTSPGHLDARLVDSRALHIAVVTETYPPEVNGVATTIARFVEGLRQRGHRVHLVRPRQDEPVASRGSVRVDESLVVGLPIPGYPHLRMGLPATRMLRRLWQADRPDVVHLVTEGPLGWSALRAALQLGLPVCSDFRTNFHAYSTHYGIGWLQGPISGYLRRFHNRTRLTMVPTEAMRSELAGRGIHNLHVVARGVDTEHFHPSRRSDALRHQWGAEPGTQVVLHVGRLAREKNPATLTAAMLAMRAVRPGTRLVIVGDGPERAALQARHPDAVFAGLRSGADLAAHYASADVFVFPSVTETFGNVVPEAMASGLAVLAYDYAAAAQLIRHDENGLLAPFDHTSAFVRMASSLAADRRRERVLGERARETALGMSWHAVVAQLEAALRHTAQRACPPGAPRQAPALAEAARPTRRGDTDADIDRILPAPSMTASAGS